MKTYWITLAILAAVGLLASKLGYLDVFTLILSVFIIVNLTIEYWPKSGR